MAKRDLHKVLFPKQRRILATFGEDLLFATKRRGPMYAVPSQWFRQLAGCEYW